jgi:hypothetical protein
LGGGWFFGGVGDVELLGEFLPLFLGYFVVGIGDDFFDVPGGFLDVFEVVVFFLEGSVFECGDGLSSEEVVNHILGSKHIEVNLFHFVPPHLFGEEI